MKRTESLGRIVVTLAALVAAMGCLLACSRKSAAGGEGEKAGNTADSAAEVTVTKVARADVTSALTVTGTIAALPNRDAKVSSLVQGRIAGMMVAEGDHVSPGQVLAKIEDRPFLDQIQQAEAAVEQAQANVENARLNRDRNEGLLERGIAARKDVEDARTQLSVNQAALRQAEAALALARLQLARTEVRSPLAGTVVKRFASVGEQVDGTAATPLFEIANLEEVELFGNVPAVYLGKIRVGARLPVVTDAFPGKTFAGKVVAISPAVDPSTNVGTVRIRMSNSRRLLRLGMFLSAQLPLETRGKALVVPAQAVYRDEQGNPEVYRVEGDDASAVPVKLGIETKSQVELLSGVQPGDTVILTGGYGLKDHAKVKVREGS
ncbi:MAG: hypothetical protein DMG26_00535 [Acidobacteria bacterium]|nr:MAG: hypothetical protein DMG26_00535 [Acidobacteriota bacterium]